MKSISLTLISIVALCSCTSKQANLTVACTRPIDPHGSYSVDRAKTVTGSQAEYQEFLIIPIMTSNAAQIAVEEAIKQAGPTCVGIANATVQIDSFKFFYGERAYKVTGNPIYKR